MSFNKVILAGNICNDLELKKTPNGVSVLSFNLAVGRRFADADGHVQTDFITVVCWRQTAEFVYQYFCKGKAILVCGAIQTRSWTDNSNVKRYAVEVVADEVSFFEQRREKEPTPTGTPAPANAEKPKQEVKSYGNARTEGFEALPDESDLPF